MQEEHKQDRLSDEGTTSTVINRARSTFKSTVNVDETGTLPEQRGATLEGEVVTEVPTRIESKPAQLAEPRTLVLPEDAVLQDAQGNTIVIAPRKPCWRRTKRLFRNLGAMFGLFIIGGLVLAVFGDEGVQATQDLIDQIWWPMTGLRLLAYVIVCTLVLPLLERHIRHKAAANLAARREAIFTGSSFDAAAVQQLEALEQRLEQFSLPKKWLFAFLVVFDLLALQLPYLMP